MHKPEIDPKVLDKIQKLLNLKEGAEAVGSLHEAENAASRLQELLFKHNLDLSNITFEKAQKRIKIIDDYFDLRDKFDKRESAWVPLLYGAIARNNLCRVGVGKDGIRIIGHEDNVQLVVYMAEQMIAKVRIAEKHAWDNYHGEEKRGTFRRGFFAGAASGINTRLRRDKENMQKEGNPFAVMIINKEKELDEYLNGPKEDQERRERERRAWWDSLTDAQRKAYEREAESAMKKMAKRKGPRQLSSQDGYIQGHLAGQKMNINKGLNSQE